MGSLNSLPRNINGARQILLMNFGSLAIACLMESRPIVIGHLMLGMYPSSPGRQCCNAAEMKQSSHFGWRTLRNARMTTGVD